MYKVVIETETQFCQAKWTCYVSDPDDVQVSGPFLDVEDGDGDYTMIPMAHITSVQITGE